MSGGALDYAYNRVEEIARDVSKQATCVEHRALVKHLMKVSTALRALEWVLSGDDSPGDEIQAILAVISPAEMLSTAIEQATQAAEDLNYAVRLANRRRVPRIDIIGQNGNDGDHYAELDKPNGQ